MNRSDFQQLANIRLAEARVLLAAGHTAGAYYLAGYAVECALKSCIARSVQQFDFPDKAKVNQSYSHDLESLLRTAALDATLNDAMHLNIALGNNWTIVKEWSEQDRYTTTITTNMAQDLITAIDDAKDGVLPWLTVHW